MTKLWFTLILSSLAYTVSAQFSDNFSDGNYTENPVWTANPGDFVVNDNLQLQSANSDANATFFITTANSLALNAQWEFWVRLDFNPSSVNYVDVWLVSNEQNLLNATNTGYFIRIGTTDDNISLYKKEGTSPVRIIEGTKGLLNSSSSTFKIKAIRTASNRWILLRDMTGSGNSYRSEGEVVDNAVATSSFFGLSIRQSTASFFGKHFFDDFEVRPFGNQPTSLKVQSVRAISDNTVQVTFDGVLNVASAENILRYHVSGMGNPVSAAVDPTNGSLLHLVFYGSFEPNEKKSIIIDDVADVFGNTIHQQMHDFYYYKAGRYDVVISEVFADPSPSVGLPSQKFIELKNVAGFPVNLMNWRLSDGNNTAILPSIELPADSFLIIATTSGLDAYRAYGKTISVTGFPSLNIGGSQIALYNAEGSTIHAMSYDLTTYRNEVKKDGGFSLEMINTKNGCGGSENWIASNDASGGTPGHKNSVDSDRIPEISIQVVNAWLTTPDTVMIRLNKTVDSALAVKKENYQFSDGPAAGEIIALPPFFNQVKVALTGHAVSGKNYTVTLSGLSDCAGGTMGSKRMAQFGLAETPLPRDVIINEILSEPRVTGSEYVELYNNSNKTIDLNRLFIANRNSAGDPSSVTRISNVPQLLFPGAYTLLTKDSASVIREYPFADASVFIRMGSMPSIPNDKGFVLIMDQHGEIIDEVPYDKSWHFALIKDKKGVALERISFDGQSDKGNFHSAARDVNYGTPGTKNSQNRSDREAAGEFSVSPEIFSPDNDGIDDFLTIHYSFSAAGNMTNIKIFDASGRMVRYLEKNSLSGQKGYYRWDGLDDKQQQLPQGIYIIHFESFNSYGKKQVHKKAVTLARRR